MTEKRLIIASRVISSIISPFYLPMFGVIALFMFTYLPIAAASVFARVEWKPIRHRVRAADSALAGLNRVP